MKLAVIAAVARNGAIGRDNALLWHLADDLKHFKRTTMGCPIVMGRRTFDSIGRALPGRRNVVVTRNPAWSHEGVEAAASLQAALDRLADAERVFVIGGGQLYAQALPLADELVLTEVDEAPEADTFFPPWDRSAFVETAREHRAAGDGPAYDFVTFERRDA